MLPLSRIVSKLLTDCWQQVCTYVKSCLFAVENQLIALKYKEFVETLLQLSKKQDGEILVALLGVVNTLSQNGTSSIGHLLTISGELKETLLSNGVINSLTPLTHSSDAQVVCTACTVLSRYPNLNIWTLILYSYLLVSTQLKPQAFFFVTLSFSKFRGASQRWYASEVSV